MNESDIYARISRRGFMGCTAAATLSALAGREPVLALGTQVPVSYTHLTLPTIYSV